MPAGTRAHHLAAHLDVFRARPPGPDDEPFLARLYASTRPDLAGNGSADPALLASLMAMQQRLQARDYRQRWPRAETLLLSRGGAPQARIVVDTDAQRIRLIDIAVLPEARGGGLGSALLRLLQQWAALQGLPLDLAVHHGNERARRLYLALGFGLVQHGAAADELRWRAA